MGVNTKYQQVNDKRIMVYPYNEVLLSNKNEYIFEKCNNMNESPNNYSIY